MNILLIGSGGREHALAWKLSQSKHADKLYAVPGNPGIAQFAECVSGVSIEDNDAIVALAKEKNIGLVVVGPEVPLVNGVVDALTAAGIKAFGPTKNAAELEGSKVYAKVVMRRYKIPTARSEVFGDPSRAHVYVRQMRQPFAIKADGLAAGKGVILTKTVDEAIEAIDLLMKEKAFGDAGNRVVIEEFMEGEEASVLAFTDGETIVAMPASQDHKRVNDGDEGLNTGGMGAYAPAPVMTPELSERVMEEILKPTIEGMKKEGRPYKGCLYAGLMITAKGPKVVEFNARFGDPETQVVLPLLKSDLVEVMLACVDGKLAETKIEWSDEAAVSVVMASGGYPGDYEKGKAIQGVKDAEAAGTLVFHAGTAEKDGGLVTAGGRVLNVVGVAKDIPEAVKKSYAGVEKISFEGMHYRKDIAHRALERLK
ncbi:MAG: phosphoribosylamine--glycine ligase [Schwartzia sp.]|nr:phosphoribosylamine--glycine ligase [Schwartzia sp. (in: firmicutes)]MBO6210230.1 phosphoribosylamine--glycine ligase [Schwartzia sp. (in: firmicutes)]MBO6294425.1 phosphoribosylamine--glycine ligase [Schwartzia sp. (in: firmicutes)]